MRLAYPQTLADRAPGVLERASRVLTAESRFWGDAPRPYFIGLIEPEDSGDYSGRGVGGGFALWLGKDVSSDVWMRLIAHEDMHSWISRRIGGFPAKDDDLEAWLNEGFTEAYMARILLQSGLWSPQQFVDDWNLSLARYGLSPVRTAPNARIQADRFRDFGVQSCRDDPCNGADAEAHVGVTLVNAGTEPSLNNKLTLVDAEGRRILPAYYSDNYVSLLPGERRTVDIAYPASAGRGTPRVQLRGWNTVEAQAEVR